MRKDPRSRLVASAVLVLGSAVYLVAALHWPDLAQALALLYIALIATVVVFCDDRRQR